MRPEVSPAVSKAVAVSPTLPNEEVIDLKDPFVAAILGWLIPGLGHIYQGRTRKGVLFMVTILGTFFYGLFISEGRAVYASWVQGDYRYPYLCQVCVGLPALPALVQTYLVRNGREPLFGGVMAPPANVAALNDMWKRLNRQLDLGTVYTMIAGLLNVLAIYDAYGGPVRLEPEEPPPGKKEEDDSGEKSGG
jgi:TM2 domain-containing membrane protein YozV